MRLPDFRGIAWLVLLVGSCPAAVCVADDTTLRFGGHVKYQITTTDYRKDDAYAAFGDDPARDQGFELRLKAEGRRGPWDGVAHYELLAVAGDTLEARRRLALLGLLTGTDTGLPDDRRRLFDLTDEITDRTRTAAVQRLDRLSLGHSTPGQVIRFGRQAVSWGNGLVFHPLDFVNPFSPIAIDKDYKTGDDMLYGQWTLAVGEETATAASPRAGRTSEASRASVTSRGPRFGPIGETANAPSLARGPRLDPIGDIQAILLPRRDAVTRDIEGEESTFAVKLRQRLGAVDLDVLAARHYDENMAGLGLVRSVGGAVWRFDAAVTDRRGDGYVWSAVTNLDTSWTWGGKNLYGYVEYFRNGFGESDRADYIVPNAALAARLARGELFTLARDYAALGAQLELTPLFNLHASVIRNLNDASHYAQLRAVYDWQQNLQLMAGLDVPHGARGSEFGGIPAPGLAVYSAPGRSLYARLAYYF
jgi:hypothetical protein